MTEYERRDRVAHQEFIRELIHNPIETYTRLSAEFPGKQATFGQFEELWPVVEYLFDEVQSMEIMNLCRGDRGLLLQRKIVVQDLRHVSLKNRVIAPYVPTILAINKALEFLDVCTRYRALCDADIEIEQFIAEEENPRERNLAYYHRYRYLYYFSWLMDKIPDVFLVPTMCHFSARDLLRFRCVPIFILGVSTKSIYVDEFMQTPIEFFMHDANHARRQYMMNLRWYREHDIFSEADRKALYLRMHDFTKGLLDALEIYPGDSEEEIAMKNLKVMILFEVGHEDADLLLPETIGASLQRVEGFTSDFEYPVVDHETGLMDIVDTKETGIATLAYVRHKLQRNFYHPPSRTNNHLPPQYCTTRHIARAAYELLRDIGVKANTGIPTDENGYVHEEWLLQRACSVGPEIVHENEVQDPDLESSGNASREVNAKQYFAMGSAITHDTEEAVIAASQKRPALASVQYAVDVLLFVEYNGESKVLLKKRKDPPQAGMYALPGGFLWKGEDGKTCIARILRDKIGIEGVVHKQLGTFDSPLRDPRGHIISTVYFAVIPYEDIRSILDTPASEVDLFSISEVPDMAFDHKEVLASGWEGVTNHREHLSVVDSKK